MMEPKVQDTRVMLVYQAGIANVFLVDCFNLNGRLRKAERLYQGAFAFCQAFASGMGAAGAIVRTAACNQVGDIANSHWSDDLEKEPFAEYLMDVRVN